jgi:hypothetical protein
MKLSWLLWGSADLLHPRINLSRLILFTAWWHWSIHLFFLEEVSGSSGPVRVGILKRGKDAHDLTQSCLLKFLTLLMLCEIRVREWCEARGIIPHSQNGFMPGRRTVNNCFILRCAIDKARALNQELYFDLSNAFPWTDLPTLWSKLHRLGM